MRVIDHKPFGGAMKQFKPLGILGAAFLAAVATVAWVTPAQAENTTSQASSGQLNQLFGFETTPNKSQTGEGYATAEFRF